MVVFAIESISNVLSVLCSFFSRNSLDHRRLDTPVYQHYISFVRGCIEGRSGLHRIEKQSCQAHFSWSIRPEKVDLKIRIPNSIRSLLKNLLCGIPCVPNVDGAVLRAGKEVGHLSFTSVPPVNIEVWWHKLNIVHMHFMRIMNLRCHHISHSYYLLLCFIDFLIRHRQSFKFFVVVSYSWFSVFKIPNGKLSWNHTSINNIRVKRMPFDTRNFDRRF